MVAISAQGRRHASKDHDQLGCCMKKLTDGRREGRTSSKLHASMRRHIIVVEASIPVWIRHEDYQGGRNLGRQRDAERKGLRLMDKLTTSLSKPHGNASQSRASCSRYRDDLADLKPSDELVR
jgi:hypothetical protein